MDDATAYAEWVGKRLPREKEWEWAARGSLVGKEYPWGDQEPSSSRANYGKNVGKPTPVGSYPANGYELHDMAGNVWEWVSDWYSRTYYNRGTKNNPKGLSKGEFKSLRGGSWVNYADSLRSAFRRWSRPDVRFNDTGFRCAKSVPLE